MPTIAVSLRYGVANPDNEVRMFTNWRGQTYVGGYWGMWRTYANLPAEEVFVRWVDPPQPTLDDLLAEFVVEADIAAFTLPVIHTACGRRVCHVQDGDSLEILVDVARTHECVTR